MSGSAKVEQLTVRTSTGVEVLSGVDLAVAPGEIVGLAGETGSGKTTLGLSLLGYVAPGLAIAGGSVTVSEMTVSDARGALTGEALRALRGRVVSYVPQDPSAALNPGMRVGSTFREIMTAHGVKDELAQVERMAELFAAVGLPAAPEFARRFPHQLSGGQLQRVAIAAAFAMDPAVVVMDEPTTGLDVTTTRRVVALVRKLTDSTGAGVVFVSHDLRLLLDLADRVVVLLEGRVVEAAPPAALLAAAEHPYTRRLLDAMPTVDGASAPIPRPEAGTSPALEVRGLTARYGKREVTQAVSFSVERGETVALVGESGSGKTTTARCVAGFHPEYAGQILLEGSPLASTVQRRARAQKAAIQYVFQNPYGSLNPRRRVGPTIALAAQLLHGDNRSDAERAARGWLDRVGLRPEHFDALPQQLSGGQRQRVALARALAARPSVLVCDEVTSSLDVSVQRDIIGLLQELQEQERLAMLFITHDLALARWLAHETLVLLDGSIVESGLTASVLADPQHDYTRVLVESASIRSRAVPGA